MYCGLVTAVFGAGPLKLCCVLIPVHAFRGHGRDADAYPRKKKKKIQKVSVN